MTEHVAPLTKAKRPRRRRRSGRAGAKLPALLLDLLVHAYEQQYALQLVCAYFRARSSVFWMRDSHSLDDFYAYSAYNRPDISIGENNSFFSLSDSDVLSAQSFADRTPLFGHLGQDPFGPEWLRKPYTRALAAQGVRYIYLMPIVDAADAPFSVLSLYFHDQYDLPLLHSHLPVVGSFLQALVTRLVLDVDTMNGEHRKTGHEIDAAARSVLGALTKLSATLASRDGAARLPSSVDDNINDARTAISVIREAATQSRFSDSVRSGRNRATLNSLRDEFNSATQPLLAGISPRRVELSTFQIEQGNASVLMSSNHLRQLLDNLMSNAIKYSTTGGVIRPSFVRDHSGMNAVLTISNTSAGLPLTEWSKIWNQRFRGRNARNSDAPGEGVGLAIVREICEGYGITYQYSETQADGSKVRWSHFSLLFPGSLVRWARG